MVDVLTQKCALVTGGSRGIGAAIVKRLASDGADVAFTYASSPGPAGAVRQAVESLGRRALAIQADSADPAALTAAVDQAAGYLGRIDILVNSAGVLAVGPLDDFKLADLDRTLAVNVRAVFVAAQAAARHMGAGGRIVTIGSTNADRMPFPGGALYAMSKAAVAGLTKGLARDLGPRGITVNNLQPGPVDTDMNPADGPAAATLLALMAVPRFGTADEIASLVAYLCGPEAAYITGASLNIDGGFGA